MPYVDGFLVHTARTSPHTGACAAGEPNLEGVRRARVPRMRRRGPDQDDVPEDGQAKNGETVLFSWVVYKSRAQRDRVNAKVMKDPRVATLMTGDTPFDVKRMAMGGFKVLVDA